MTAFSKEISVRLEIHIDILKMEKNKAEPEGGNGNVKKQSNVCND